MLGYRDFLDLHREELRLVGREDEAATQSELDPDRERVFHSTCSRIDVHNRRGGSFRLGLNHFADWLPHETSRMFHVFGNRAGNTSLRINSHRSWPSDAVPDSIDWSTSSNPLQDSVVPEVKNQGMCGSCWAFSTIASTEASVRITRGVQPPALSVQELVDCDTEFNRGCYGGNPVLAYDYVMTKGVTSWQEYPYMEMRGKCRRSYLDARAKIDGFIIISSFDQRNLKKFVAAGPVSIGICGTDFSFMFYAGGVFDYAECCTVQNHGAMQAVEIECLDCIIVISQPC